MTPIARTCSPTSLSVSRTAEASGASPGSIFPPGNVNRGTVPAPADQYTLVAGDHRHATAGSLDPLACIVTSFILAGHSATRTLPAMPLITCCHVLLSLPPEHAGTSATDSIWAVDVPIWITSIATVGLLAGAIITAVYAARAFSKQAEEVAILADQNREHQQALEHEAAERHREQASRVWVMMVPDDEATKRDYPAHRPAREPAEADAGGPSLEALVRNTSEHQVPVFDAKLHWYRGSEPYGTPNPEPLLDVPGYENTARSRVFPTGTDLSTCGAFLTFRDAAGFGWLRAPGGGAPEERPPGELDDAAKAAIRAHANGGSPP
jgi:hypothetical protein